MLTGIASLAKQAPKVAAILSKVGRPKIKPDFVGPKLPPGKIKDPDIDYNIWSDYDIYKDKMRGQIGSNKPYDPEFIGPRKGVANILETDYTGARPAGQEGRMTPIMVGRGHKAQKVVRPNDSQREAIELLKDNPKNYVAGFTRGSSVDDYVDKGAARFGRQDYAFDIHPDFLVPKKYERMVDFRIP